MPLHHDDLDPDELEELLAEPHFNLGTVLLRHAPLLRQMGLRMPLDQLLGSGEFGAAYKVPWGGQHGSVLKLTRDPTEVPAAYLLRGRDSKRIVHIHGVWYLKDSWEPGLQRWYLVHRAYLHPLKEKDKLLIEMIFAIYDDTDPRDVTLPRSFKQRTMIDKWRGYLREELGGQGGWTDHEGESIAPTVSVNSRDIKRAMQLLLQIGAAVDEMHKAGIDWEDIHSDNLMRGDDGRLVIADIGWGLLHEDFEGEIPALTTEEVHAHRARFEAPPAEGAQAP